MAGGCGGLQVWSNGRCTDEFQGGADSLETVAQSASIVFIHGVFCRQLKNVEQKAVKFQPTLRQPVGQLFSVKVRHA